MVTIDTESDPGAWDEHFKLMQNLHGWNKPKTDDKNCDKSSKKQLSD